MLEAVISGITIKKLNIPMYIPNLRVGMADVSMA